MTFKEKLIQEHPNKVGFSEKSITVKCPWRYGYESKDKSIENCIRNSGNGCEYCWSREMPEERNDDTKKEFTKADLKDGMLCRTRDGRLYMWLYGDLRRLDFWCSGTRENLEGSASVRNDIVKVGYPNLDFIDSVKSVFERGIYETIWERQEEPTTKDVSLEELNAILKEKFPDIDKFNLPIKE